MTLSGSTRIIHHDVVDGQRELLATYPSALELLFAPKSDPRARLVWISLTPAQNSRHRKEDEDARASVLTSGDMKWRLTDRPGKHEQQPHNPIPGTNLCTACENIEIAQLLYNGPSIGHHLGLSDHLSACQSCDLCHLVMQGLEVDSRQSSNSTSHNHPDDAAQFFTRNSFVVLESTSTIVPLPHARRHRPFELKASLLHMDTRQILATTTIRLLGRSAEKLRKISAFHGRLVDPLVASLKLAQQWLSECCLTHECARSGSEKSAHSVGQSDAHKDATPDTSTAKSAATGVSLTPSPNSSPSKLRVVDVQQERLCMIEWSEEYVALSYVWPRFESLRLTRHTREELEQPGALSRLRVRLPKVLQDAIDVVRGLGQRYLWVDALCITQDDDTEKTSLIQAMDRVYGGSLVTLAIATSTSPEKDYGIPGINGTPRTTRQYAAEIEGVQLVTALRGPESIIDTSVWSTRGWTFQEGLLSKRCLIFSDDQMYFRCPRDYRCEEIQGEGQAPQKHHPAMPRTLRGRQHYLEYLLGNKFLENVSKEDTFRTYAQLVGSYTPRNFTNSEDILDALHGIMTALMPHFPEPRGFFVGCPMHLFDRALLWYPTGPLERRRSIKGVQLPSWSWVGWKGSVAYEMDVTALGDFDSQRPMVLWWRKDGRGGNSLVPLRNYSEHIHEGTALSHGMLISKSRNMTPTQLIFWGLCMRLSVSKSESRISHWLTDSMQSLPCFTVLDNEGDPCGFLPAVDRDWAKTHSENNRQQQYDFLLLSLADQSRFDGTDQRSQWFHPKYKIPTIADRLKYVCFMNVMLIEYDAEGVAQRRGIGRVHMSLHLVQDVDVKIVILG